MMLVVALFPPIGVAESVADGCDAEIMRAFSEFSFYLCGYLVSKRKA